MDQVLQALFVW